MGMINVKSSSVKSVGWFNDVLFIEYVGGNTYIYIGVNKSLFEDLINTHSKGKFMNTYIKSRFEYKKVK